MRVLLRHLLRTLAPATLAAASAVSVLGSPAGAGAEAPATRVEGPTFTRYEAKFTAELTLNQFALYGEKDYYDSSAFVKMSGTIPNVRFLNSRLLTGYGRGWLKVSSGNTGSEAVTDDGREKVSCVGSSVVPEKLVPPQIVPVNGKMTFKAFGALTSRESCDNSDLLTPDPKRVLPAIPVPFKVKASRVGDNVIRVPFKYTVPVASCPDYAGPDHSRYCVYKLEGTMTLRQVPDIDVFRAPTKASLAKAAARASVVAGCSTACTATLTVQPLTGAGSASTREKLRPRMPETLAVNLDKKLSKAVVASGGALLEVTYRSSDGTQTFSKTVRR